VEVDVMTKTDKDKTEALHTADYMRLIGVKDLPAKTCPLDPGYAPITVESHLEQSSHLISILKMSMACWQIANEKSTRRKIAAAKRYKIPVCTGGGPFEVASAFGRLEEFLDLCSDMGVSMIEAGEGFTNLKDAPSEVVRMAGERGLKVQFEIGKKHDGVFGAKVIDGLIDKGLSWLDAGAEYIVVEAMENARGIGLFDDKGALNRGVAERFAEAFTMEKVIFEAPTKLSQFALLRHFGPAVHLSNVRLEELLRVEIYRRGLHSGAFMLDNLRPRHRHLTNEYGEK